MSFPHLSEISKGDELVVMKDFQMSRTWQICRVRHTPSCQASQALVDGHYVQLRVARHVVEVSSLFQKFGWWVEFHDWSIVKDHDPENKNQSISMLKFSLFTLCFKVATSRFAPLEKSSLKFIISWVFYFQFLFNLEIIILCVGTKTKIPWQNKKDIS